ncbi:hypothetical protein AtEden1_Chr3g0207181 [Arabidopsis thaliana]
MVQLCRWTLDPSSLAPSIGLPPPACQILLSQFKNSSKKAPPQNLKRSTSYQSSYQSVVSYKDISPLEEPSRQ